MTNWHWPQYAIAGLFVIRFIINLTKHGEPREEYACKYNAGHALFAGLLTSGILYFGGFWS